MRTAVFTTVMMVAVIGTSVAQVWQSSPAPVVPTKHLTRKQAERLINTAITPEEHRELAEFFRQEAQRKRDKEQYYLEVVTTYRLHPPRVDSYRNTPTQGRYEQMADEARDQALADDRRAFLEEGFAHGLSTSK